MLVWENEQATSWFVGILEGEGSFHVREGGSIRIQIHNNDKDIIDYCVEFLRTQMILSNVYIVKAGKKKGYKLCISRQDCINLYTRLGHKLECRKTEYQRIMGASETTCVTSVSVDLHWLIGIWEAEGCFLFIKDCNEKIIPKIELDNTNSKIIDKIISTFKFLGLAFYAGNYVPDKKKPYTKISIAGVLRCKKFLEKTRNLWRSDRNYQRSEAILNFINSRLSKEQKETYSEQEVQWFHRVRLLNS